MEEFGPISEQVDIARLNENQKYLKKLYKHQSLDTIAALIIVPCFSTSVYLAIEWRLFKSTSPANCTQSDRAATLPPDAEIKRRWPLISSLLPISVPKLGRARWKRAVRQSGLDRTVIGPIWRLRPTAKTIPSCGPHPTLPLEMCSQIEAAASFLEPTPNCGQLDTSFSNLLRSSDWIWTVVRLSS